MFHYITFFNCIILPLKVLPRVLGLLYRVVRLPSSTFASIRSIGVVVELTMLGRASCHPNLVAPLPPATLTLTSPLPLSRPFSKLLP